MEGLFLKSNLPFSERKFLEGKLIHLWNRNAEQRVNIHSEREYFVG